MNVRLMHPDRDFVPPEAMPRHERYGDWDRLPRDATPHEQALTQDLALEAVLRAMAGADEFVLDVARWALSEGLRNDADTILYRQDILTDCLRNPAAVRTLYDLAVEAIEGKRNRRLGIFSWSYPSGTLSDAVALLRFFVDELGTLRRMAEVQGGRFASRGFAALFEMLRKELSDAYFAAVRSHLAELEFRGGVLLSAELGSACEGINVVLRQRRRERGRWLKRFLSGQRGAYAVRIDPRDEGGARILGDLRDRGINGAANAAAQSAEHILNFFDTLRTELAFYVGCLNLSDKLAALGAPFSLPRPEAAGTRRRRFRGIYDISLALTLGRRPVGNSLDADGRSLVLITGANQGGKSTFLRSIGQAQLMMHCGMFVAAESFTAELCTGLYTHYKREEDTTMKSGKLDEELGRMSAIADVITPNAMLLFNESFASTNEREGSEIARQIVGALVEKGIVVCCVTHLYDFARSLLETRANDAVFLRAERSDDGTRTFRLLVGEPLETSYGHDVYERVFAEAPADADAALRRLG